MTVFLETERLILRRFTADDVDHLYELDSDPVVTRHVRLTPDSRPTEYTVIREQILPRYLQYYEQYEGYGYWAAVARAGGEFLGWFHFRPDADNPDEIELGYRLRRAAWGQGYATEGARALIHKGFTELGTQRVVATALAANAASIRVMEKAGLRFERTFLYPGTDQEGVKYALNRSEFTPEAETVT